MATSSWHESRRAAQVRLGAEAGRRAGLYLQKERIVGYLPVLAAQREKMAADLAELDALIEDEQQAVVEITRELDADAP